jgi:hypothetical protein
MTQFASIPRASANPLERFKGAELTTVMVWKFGVKLSFDDEPCTITIENNVEFASRGQTESYNQGVIVSFGAHVVSLIGCHIIDLQIAENKTLALNFDDGSILTVRPDMSGYESYQVSSPDGMLIG